jgi:hypothetical protein
VKVARGSGAIAVAMGECLDALCTGDGPMRLGYANLGDYVREELSLAPRTAKEWAKLARDLRSRPLLRAAVVDRALDVAGKVLRANTPKWQRVEAIAQEYLGSHPDPRPPAEVAGDGAGASSSGPGHDIYALLGIGPSKPSPELREWLEREYDRWSYLRSADPVPAPEAGVDDHDRALRMHERLLELASMRRGWDELVGHLSMLLINTGLWRDMKFLDVDHYATERLGMSGRAIEQMCTRKEWAVRLPADVHQVFSAACRAVRAAAQEWVGASKCLVVMCQHFIDTYEAETRRPNTPSARAMERDRGLCTCPGCSKAADHVHHIKYRSHGGGDEDWNLTSVCAAHHLHGVHDGYVRVRGEAPFGLQWELGERPVADVRPPC